MSGSSGRQFTTPALVDRLAPLVRLSARSPVSARTLAGLCALVPAVFATLYRVAHNAPGTLPPDITAFASGTLPLAIVGPAVAALLLAADDTTPVERVGLAFAGGFGVLAALSPAAWLPAAAGIATGGVLVTAVRRERAGTTIERLSDVCIRGILVAAVVSSLLATAGVRPATLRPLGSMLVLVGIGATPVLVGRTRTSLLAGGVGGLLTFALATSVPYVAGAVLLVGGRVVGAPLGLVVLAVAGGVTSVVAALERGRVDGALGSSLLLVAGVPAGLLGALAVVVALALLPVTTAESSHLASGRGGVSS